MYKNSYEYYRKKYGHIYPYIVAQMTEPEKTVDQIIDESPNVVRLKERR